MRPRRQPPTDERFRFEHPIEVRFADTDALGHVNNAVYLTYFEAARAGYYAAAVGAPFGTGEKAGERTFVVAEATVSFRRPCFFGETVLVGCRFAWASRSSFGIEYSIRAEESPVAGARHIADGESVQVMFDLERQRAMRVPDDLLQMFEAFEGRAIGRR
jgi:acyl-CoA thioester hydrolase